MGGVVEQLIRSRTVQLRTQNVVNVERKMCRSKSANEVEVAADDFLFTEERIIGSIEGWKAQIQINGKSAQFKLDTCANGTVVGEQEPWLKDKAQAQPDGSKRSQRENARIAWGFLG